MLIWGAIGSVLHSVFFLVQVGICTFPLRYSCAFPLASRLHLMFSSSESYPLVLQTFIDVEAVESPGEEPKISNDSMTEASVFLSSSSSQPSIYFSSTSSSHEPRCTTGGSKTGTRWFMELPSGSTVLHNQRALRRGVRPPKMSVAPSLKTNPAPFFFITTSLHCPFVRLSAQ